MVVKKKRGKNNNKTSKHETNKIAYKKKVFFAKEIFIPIRYLILLLLMFSLPIIYYIFTPLTIYPVFQLLSFVYNKILLYGNIIIINQNTTIEIIPSCIAGSAYLLLLILNLTVPMTVKKRIYTLILSILILLVLNILRIFALSILFENNFPLFNLTHKLFWYALSVVFVVGIWFLMVKIFSIKEIPVYSDVKSILVNIKKN